jgi:hypothetical protein
VAGRHQVLTGRYDKGVTARSGPRGGNDRAGAFFEAIDFSVAPQKNRGSDSAARLWEFRQSTQAFSAERRPLPAERALPSFLYIHHREGGANDARNSRSRMPANGFSFFAPQKNQKNRSPAIKTVGFVHE